MRESLSVINLSLKCFIYFLFFSFLICKPTRHYYISQFSMFLFEVIYSISTKYFVFLYVTGVLFILFTIISFIIGLSFTLNLKFLLTTGTSLVLSDVYIIISKFLFFFKYFDFLFLLYHTHYTHINIWLMCFVRVFFFFFFLKKA
jgi:hypothetical protein